MKAFIEVKLTNVEEFQELSEEFTKKAHELEDLANRLKTFRFTGEVQHLSDSDQSKS